MRKVNKECKVKAFWITVVIYSIVTLVGCYYERKLYIKDVARGVYGGQGIPLLLITFLNTFSLYLLISAINRFKRISKAHPELKESKKTINTHIILFFS